jgi:diguanylate cyclase (GGDEF)-like protein
MSLLNFLGSYYILTFILAVLLFTILSNRGMYYKVKDKFLIIVILVVLETVFASIEVHFAEQPYKSFWRDVLSTICYILRPSIMYVMLLIITRNDSRRLKAIYGIPLVLSALILIVDLPDAYNLVFGYSDKNTFEMGPLFPITYGVLLFYLIAILVMTYIKCGQKLGGSEMLTVYMGCGFILLNIIGEREGFLHGNNENATALAVLVYAIHFKTVEDRIEKTLLETTEIKTGLLNENTCIAKLNEKLRHSDPEQYACVYFDLARFGLINEQYGMDIGNRVIAEYARILGGVVRSDELLARQGGDRFIAVILRRNLDVLLAQIASTRVRFTEAGEEYDLTLSAHVGVYLIERDDISAEEIISNANTALGYGKNAGNSVIYLTPELKNLIREEKQFATDIPIAMAGEEFVAFYQPKVNSRTNTLCGAEALVRWSHNGELIPPTKFVPILETKELMCDMDFYMLRRVCADIAGWIERGLVPPTISVNFSRRNLSNPHLAADIDAVVNEYHVPKKMIEIEITETIDEFPISVLKTFVDDLHSLGYKVAVDDFGSGSSSLSLLREVSFDVLKIDKGFVDRNYAKDLAILSYIIKLSNAIGVEVLAEGVELKEQVENLKSLGCYVIQGYYYDRALPKSSFEKRIINRRYQIEQN